MIIALLIVICICLIWLFGLLHSKPKDDIEPSRGYKVKKYGSIGVPSGARWSRVDEVARFNSRENAGAISGRDAVSASQCNLASIDKIARRVAREKFGDDAKISATLVEYRDVNAELSKDAVAALLPRLNDPEIVEAQPFGSFARGTNIRGSDADVFVILRNDTQLDLPEMKDLIERLCKGWPCERKKHSVCVAVPIRGNTATVHVDVVALYRKDGVDPLLIANDHNVSIATNPPRLAAAVRDAQARFPIAIDVIRMVKIWKLILKDEGVRVRVGSFQLEVLVLNHFASLPDADLMNRQTAFIHALGYIQNNLLNPASAVGAAENVPVVFLPGRSQHEKLESKVDVDKAIISTWAELWHPSRAF